MLKSVDPNDNKTLDIALKRGMMLLNYLDGKWLIIVLLSFFLIKNIVIFTHVYPENIDHGLKILLVQSCKIP